MFRASLCPASGVTITAVAASGFYRWSVVVAVLLVVVGPVVSPSSDGKPEAATAVIVAPDDGHEDARNMLSYIETTSKKLEKLLHLVG